MVSRPGAAPNIGGQYFKLKKGFIVKWRGPLADPEEEERKRKKVNELPKRTGGSKSVVLWLLADTFPPKNHLLPETRRENQPDGAPRPVRATQLRDTRGVGSNAGDAHFRRGGGGGGKG